jgi:uncharacterized membrane-anchored protein YhcB (DUF1043 family)
MESDENNLLVNIYFVSWMILSAFLLVNIIVGAIVNNYDLERQKARADEQDNRLDFIQQQLEELVKNWIRRPERKRNC